MFQLPRITAFCLLLLAGLAPRELPAQIRLSANPHELSLAEFSAYLDLDQRGIDTLIRKKGYRLMQKDQDSVSTQYYYSHLERGENQPAWVRALSWVEVRRKEFFSRLMTYRTYNREEYQRFTADMLRDGYQTKNEFKLPNAVHTVFYNGKRELTVKITNNKMENGRRIRTYEFEAGH